MKVLHAPYCYFPDAVGGAEVYAAALAACQQRLGMAPAIAAPAPANGAYTHEGIPVYRYRVSPSLDLRDQYGEGDPEAAAVFEKILEQAQPDVLHLHAFTSGVSLRVARAAKRRGIAVVFTYHTPTVTCDRGTLLEWGSKICDGAMGVRRCARCGLHAQGLAKPVSWVVGSVPVRLGAKLSEAGRNGGAWTALKMTELSRLRRAAVQGLFEEADRIVAVCEWVKKLLVRNGMPAEKVTLCRQGLANGHSCSASKTPGESPAAGQKPWPHNLRAAFFGRLDAIKGIDTLIDAMRIARGLDVTLDIFAIVQDEAAKRLKIDLEAKTASDSRIRFQEPVAPRDVVERIREYDLLAVPSRCLETGPMVVYEAFAAGTPVIGSNLGGIAELVEHEANGLLVEPNQPAAWAMALRRIAEDRDLLSRLRLGIRPVRTMDEAAREMQPVYEASLRGAMRMTA